LGISLRDPCRAAKALDISAGAKARAFFEERFLPLRISRLGEDDGFVTGYYEPVLDGSRTQTDVYNVPVYRRPSNLFVRGFKQDAVGLPNKGQVFRKIGRRKLVPYYDRAEIEDGALAGRGLEICWLKDQTDLLFTQIQGSARIRLEDGSTMRINYDAHNGYPYTPVGRILIDRGIIPKEQMSMQKIREWMDQNPDGAKELRRQNRSYIFFREVNLSDKDEAVGAQGVPLTPGRSIAVDKALHVYGTPFFIGGELPVESELSNRTPAPPSWGLRAPTSISAPAPMPDGYPAVYGTICVLSCWCRRVSIRWRGAARCRSPIQGPRRQSPSCSRKPIP
jgi:membrane-bound lytic murein transglycosylase A